MRWPNFLKRGNKRLQAPQASTPETTISSRIVEQFFSGDKFFESFGATKDYRFIDYYELRMRSYQLFTENHYASGLIKRLLTNEINTGLTLEATPAPTLTGMTEDEAEVWAENVETIFTIWGNNAALTDWRRQMNFGELQRELRKTALIAGDALVILRQSPVTRLPVIEIIPGGRIVNPTDQGENRRAIERGNKILHGVEIDPNGRHVAFYVMSSDERTIKRVLAIGPRSGRRIAWMVYGTERRLVDEVRGIPLLGCILSAIKELDRYKDAEQRAAAVNATLALWIKKTEAKIGTRPVTGGAVRRESVQVTQEDNTTRTFNTAKWLPGTAIDELQQGEEPVSFDTRRPNVNFKAFEDAMVSGFAWSQEIPPEILVLSFNNNYSASRAAINEFKIYLDASRTRRAAELPQPVYVEWLISMVQTSRIVAPGFLEAWRDPNRFVEFGAWILSEWAGAIKPSVDREKEVKAYERMAKSGYVTHDRASKELTGTKFSTNIRRVRKENELIAEALQPLIDAGLIKPVQPTTAMGAAEIGAAIVDEVADQLGDRIQ